MKTHPHLPKSSLKSVLQSLTLLGALTLAACAGSKNNPDSAQLLKGVELIQNERGRTIRVDLSASNFNSPNESAASNYAKRAMILFSPATFAESIMMAEQAYLADPKNDEAQLAYFLTRPVAQARGFFLRVQPIIDAAHLKEQEYFERQKRKTQTQFPELYDFLMDRSGGPLMLNEDHVLGFIDQQMRTTQAAHEAIKGIEAEQFVFYFVKVEKGAEGSASCRVELEGNFLIIPGCKNTTLLEKELDRSDLLAIRHSLAGQLVLQIVSSGYDATGLISAYQLQPDSNQKLVNHLLRVPQFGQRRGNGWQKLIPLGADLVPALKSAYRLSETLCSRSERFLVSDCAFRSSQKAASRFDLAAQIVDVGLSGGMIPAWAEKERLTHIQVDPTELRPVEQVEFTIQARNFIDRATNLKAFQPRAYDQSGEVTEILDGSLVGTLQGLSVNDILLQRSERKSASRQ